MSVYRCLQPEYVKDFRCDGKACDAQCCRGWNIQLDKEAVERFHKAPKKLRRELFSHISKNETTGVHEIVKKNDACPMLGGDLLCSLQKRRGEGFLADVCAEYPRLTTQFPEKLERALCMTCPVAAKLALLNETPMKFEEVEVTTQRESYFQQADDEEAIARLRIFDLQKESIGILQDRSLPLPGRLVKLALFLDRAESLVAEERGEEISQILTSPEGKKLSAGEEVPFFERAPFALVMLRHLAEKSEDDDPKTGEFLTQIASLLEGKEPASLEECYREYEGAVLQEWGHILENYLVNEYFSAIYPCVAVGDFRHNARVFGGIYALLELVLVSLWKEKGTIGEEEILEVIHWLAVRVKHFVGYINLLAEFLEEHGDPLFLRDDSPKMPAEENAPMEEKIPEEERAKGKSLSCGEEESPEEKEEHYDSEVLSVNLARVQLQSVPNVVYAQKETFDYANVLLQMDILRPQEKENLPAILFVPGGGFIASNRARMLQLRMRLAEAGYFVGSINYRVTPEALFPAPLEDVKSAVRYMKAHGEELHIDPQRIGIIGDSAGGYLSAFAGITNYPTEFDRGEYLEVGSQVKAAVSLYGISDLLRVGEGFPREWQEFYTSPAGIPSLFVNGIPGFGGRMGGILENREFMEKANPIRYIRKESAPMLLFHGTEDPVVSQEQSDILYQALRKKGVAAKRYLVPGAGHSGPYWVQDEVIRVILEFFEHFLTLPSTLTPSHTP